MSKSGTLRHPNPRAAPRKARISAQAGRVRAGGAAAIARHPGLAARAAPITLLAIGVLFALWQVVHVRGYTYADWNGAKWSPYDEGVYLVSARSLNAGQAIFKSVFSSQPPLFLAGLALALRLAGGAAGAAHLYSLLCGLLALGGVAWLCWEIAGRWSALLACALLALSPGFVIASRAIEAEAPMLAFGSLAVAAAARYARLAGRRWLVLAALLLAAATLSKLLAVADIVPVLAALVLARPARDSVFAAGRLAVDAALAAASFALPIAAAFLLLDPADQYDQVVRFHLRASDIYSKPPLVTGNSGAFGTFLGWDPGLLALAVVGIAVAALGSRKLALIPFSWLLATLATLVRYHPLFIHHLTVLLAPLAALGGLALAFPQGTHWVVARRLAAGLLLVCALLVYLVWLPEVLSHDRGAFVTDRNPVRDAQVAWLKAHSSPSDLVVVDDQLLAAAANRLVPPALTDTSIVRANSGYLPLPLVIQATDDPRVRAVLLTRQLLYGDPGYVAWVRRHFRAVAAPPQALAFVAR